MTIERDEWLYVQTDSPERAREFFGAPPDAECRLDGEDREGRPMYAVRAADCGVH